MSALVVTITTQQPLLASAIEGDPNSGETFPYIPGSVLRGALIARYNQPINLADATVKSLFFSNDVRFLHAYPLLEHNQRAIPLPHLLTVDTSNESLESIADTDPTSRSAKDKGLPPEWLGCNGNSAHKFRTMRHLNIHTTRNRAKGRSTRASGAVYRYVAIAPGQTFQAVILGDATALGELKTLLGQQPTVWMGGARSAGYGEVLLSTDEIVSDWHETAAAPAAQTPIVMTLLSDAIVRDHDGQYARSLTGSMFGLPNATIDWQQSKVKYTVVGGFNRKWGLPLPQTPALAAGSVLTWDNVQPTELALLAERGIGERRNEGYGRVSFDPTLQNSTRTATKLLHRTAPPADTVAASPLFNDEAQVTLDRIGTGLIRQKLEQRLVGFVGEYQIKTISQARNSLFGRVELWARQLLEQVQRAPENVKGQIDSLAEIAANVAQTARQQLRATRFTKKDETLAVLLGKDLDTVTAMWRNDVAAVKLGDQTFMVTPALAAEYQARLIIAIVTIARNNPAEERGNHE